MKRNCAKDLPEFRSGDTIKVHVRLMEGEGEKVKERIQTFEGVVISKKGRASSASFTVRRVSFGVGIERIFPLHSPSIASIDVVGKGNVRRSRLYYSAQSARPRQPASSAQHAKKLQRPPCCQGLSTTTKEFAKGQATACPFFLLGC